jgi:hypothetical protein
MNSLSFFFGAGAVVIAATLYSLRREHIRVEYSVTWLVVGCTLAVLAVFPSLPKAIASALSLDPLITLPVCAGMLISMLVFEISRVVSRIRDQTITLAQRLAIIEYQLQQVRREHDAGEC